MLTFGLSVYRFVIYGPLPLGNHVSRDEEAKQEQ